MLALAAAGALTTALPACNGPGSEEEPYQLTSYGYDPEIPEPGGFGENRMVAPGRSSDHAELLRLGHRLRFGDVLRRAQEQYPAHHFGPSGRT
jgi:hypothetical protein